MSLFAERLRFYTSSKRQRVGRWARETHSLAIRACMCVIVNFYDNKITDSPPTKKRLWRVAAICLHTGTPQSVLFAERTTTMGQLFRMTTSWVNGRPEPRGNVSAVSFNSTPDKENESGDSAISRSELVITSRLLTIISPAATAGFR